MIFKSVCALTTNSEKKFENELIQLYIRLVEVYAEKNSIEVELDLSDCSQELIDIGVIDDSMEIPSLKRFLGKEVFEKFISSVNCFLKHKNVMGDLLSKLSNKERRMKQKKDEFETPALIDFFCGAGGLSLGFIQEGFHVKLANDIEEVCIHTYAYNHPELPTSKLIQDDIKKIVDNVESFIDPDLDIDLVVGGPPCQGFSSANQQRVIDDPRNKLYKYFIQAVEKIVPKFVVMENVKGMLKVANQVVEDYERLQIEKNGKKYTYKVKYQLLNSMDFSVAQRRERLIYIAIRNDVMENYNITPQTIFDDIQVLCKGNAVYNLQDALECIKPIDAPRIKNTNEIDSDTCGKKVDINNWADNTNAYLKLINCNRTIPWVFNHKARYVSDVNYEIYKRLNSGEDATNEKIADIMPYAHRNNVFKDKYYKLYPDRPCRTITAHLRMDCHSHIHPFQIRALTPREAARVQSFPDDYLFLGAYLKTYMQVGNAVPPLMARGIAKVIKRYL